jgi:hypothetical protein
MPRPGLGCGIPYFMNNSIIDFSAPRWRQAVLKLTHVVVHDERRRLVCIPDRLTAEDERSKLKREYGAALIATNITKNGKGKSGTYTVAYTLRHTRIEELF